MLTSELGLTLPKRSTDYNNEREVPGLRGALDNKEKYLIHFNYEWKTEVRMFKIFQTLTI